MNDNNLNQTPPEAPPAAGYAPPAYPPQQPVQPVRRVGTTTMALSLIACGAILLANLVLPNVNFFTALKFTPVILVFLGLEILISNAVWKNAKLKYDLLSMFLCFFLICGSFAAAAVGSVAARISESYAAGDTFLRDTTKNVNSAVSGLPYVASVNVSASWSSNRLAMLGSLTGDAILYEDAPLQLEIYFSQPFDTREEFGEACRTVLDRILPVAPSTYEVWYTYDALGYATAEDHARLGDTLYSLGLVGYSDMYLSAEEMARATVTWVWYADEDSVNSGYHPEGHLPQTYEEEEEPTSSLPDEPASPVPGSGSADSSVSSVKTGARLPAAA